MWPTLERRAATPASNGVERAPTTAGERDPLAIAGGLAHTHRAMDVPIITFFTRRGCHLCDSALHALSREMASVEHRLEQVDIDQDQRYLQPYDLHVPVIWLNGVEVCRHRLDAPRLRAALEAARAARLAIHSDAS